MDHPIAEEIRAAVRQVENFPKEGINFYDITTVLKDGPLFHRITTVLQERYESADVDAVIGIESRGFIFGAALAHSLKLPLLLVRKPGKLPAKTVQQSYTLEYGEDSVEIHEDALQAGEKVIIVDDLIATGGTASASIDLVHRFGAEVYECAFIIELTFLDGRQRFGDVPTISLLKCSE